ncbi:MAG: sugar ABC transporter permease [Chloroflexi bacterium]|nr:sugar ABC transporter permease [Chloroflexota bacterium]
MAVLRQRFPFHIVVFLLPAFIIYTIFMAYPLLDSLRLSLVQVQDGQQVYVGLANFERLFGEPFWSERFWNALRNNLIFFAIHLLVQNPIGLLLATILTRRGLRGVPLFRTILFAPTTLSYVIVGFTWSLMLSPIWGILNTPASNLGLPTPLLGRPEAALITVALVSVWQFIGLPMMLFTAALLSIDDELLDAALVDGANAWQGFWRIRFPLILPTVGVVSILTFVGNFNAFALIYTMQGSLAGPNFATDILGTFFFRTTFGAGGAQEPNFPMGTTIATVMFLIILSVVLVYLLYIQRRLVRTEA